MTVVEIQASLGDLADRLKRVSSIASIRGDGVAQFLHVICNERAAEVSLAGEGWWVEFWGSLDGDAQPERESTLNSIAEVELALLDYFFADRSKGLPAQC